MNAAADVLSGTAIATAAGSQVNIRYFLHLNMVIHNVHVYACNMYYCMIHHASKKWTDETNL